MGLNIKNEETHAKVRRLAELTGMSMTAAIDDAVERRLREIDANPRGARGAEIDELMGRIREVFTPEVIEETKRIEADLYDQKGRLR